MATRELIIEDDADINQIVATRLERDGYLCTQAFSGSEARLLLGGESQPFDLVICDLMLPGVTGEELVATIRENGADDYLTNPFDLDELAARVEVQLRHRGHVAVSGSAGSTLRFRDWELDHEARTFIAAGKPVDLTRIEFNIVEMLMRHPSRVFTKQELFEGAWGEPYAADANTVNVHVSNIRTKLKPTGTADYIKTVWGMGFKLVG